jgi:hypothetical protein
MTEQKKPESYTGPDRRTEPTLGMIAEQAAERLASLRVPFPESVVGQLPRGGVMLSFVGHATVTDRLLTVDPLWSWEPFAVDEYGAPAIAIRDEQAVLWIRLTICDVTRIGVGITSASKPECEKELISDAIRNAAMRFGVALDLWARDGLESTPPEPEAAPAWEALGWFEESVFRDRHAAYQAAAKETSDAVRAEAKKKLPRWPMSAAQLTDAEATLIALADEEAEETKNREEAQ